MQPGVDLDKDTRQTAAGERDDVPTNTPPTRSSLTLRRVAGSFHPALGTAP